MVVIMRTRGMCIYGCWKVSGVVLLTGNRSRILEIIYYEYASCSSFVSLYCFLSAIWQLLLSRELSNHFPALYMQQLY